MNINIAIATNIDFYKKTLPIIIPSLLNSGINKEQIHIFCGGCETQEITIYEDYKFYKVEYRSFELTPLIAICEMELKTDYWFLIQDTCKVGLKFKEKLYKFPSENPDKIALRISPSMNIGTYKYDYLIKNKDYILKSKMFCKTPEDFSKNKKWTILNEDYVLWKLNPPAVCYQGTVNRISNNDSWYGGDATRITEYFSSLDLYKNKSNWGQSANYTSDL